MSERPQVPPNRLLRDARVRTPSPSGSGRPMSRQELADALNAYLAPKSPDEATVDVSQIGKLERGRHRWPNALRREAFRHVLGVASDSDLGFFIVRGIGAAEVPIPPQATPRAASAAMLSADTSPDAAPAAPPVPSRDPRQCTSVSDSLDFDRSKVPGDEDDALKRRSFLAASGLAAAALTAPTRVVQALSLTTSDRVGNLGFDIDTLRELGTHYAQVASTVNPAAIYDELLDVRAYAGARLEDSGRGMRRRSDLVVAAGYLSSVLAVVTSYMNDHASALVWCADAERRSREASHPELAGWAMLTRATIAYYQGRAKHSADLAGRGQALCQLGTVAHAKLAAQEMRARAMLRDSAGMEDAKQRAARAISKLPDDVPTSGVFSITLDEDPPYTATSLLLVQRFEQAVTATARVVGRTYRPDVSDRGGQPSNYARSLLILDLAKAGVGEAGEASAVGKEALLGTRPVWPTMVLASQLDQVLTGRFTDTPEATDFHECFLECASSPSSFIPQKRNTR